MAFNPLVINGGTEATAQRVTIANDSTGILSVDDNGGSLTIDASSLPLPTGASTSANQSTANGLLTTIDADTGNISTKIDTLAGAVAGTEVQVDVLTMPTTTVQATNLDIRDIDKASDNILIYGNTAKDGSGTSYVPLTDTDGHLQIDILSMPAGGSGLTDAELRATPVPVSVSGASTAANQTTIIGHLDGVEGLLGTIDADTGGIATSTSSIDAKTPALGQALAAASVPVVLTAAQLTTLTPVSTVTANAGTNLNTSALALETTATSIKTAVEILDNAIAGTEMQVDVVAALPAGTNNIGDVDVLTLPALPAGTNNIGDVDILSIAAGDNNIGNVDIVTMPGTGVEDAAETAGGTLLMAGTVRRDTAASSAGTTGDNATLNTDSLGRLWVSGAAVEDAAETAGGILLMAGSVRRDTAASSAGTTGDNATINTDATGRLWTTGTVIEDVAHSAGESLASNAVRRIDTAATSAGTSGDWATMDASAEGALWVTSTPTTTSGCLTFRSIDLDETEEEVKATAGNIYGYYFYNAAASIRYLKFYNATAASTTVGTTTPMRTYPIPAGAAGHVSLAYPIAFSTALSVAVTTGLADNDTGAPGANEFILNIDYK